MLNDPITLNSGAAFAAPTGGVAAPFARQGIRNGYTAYSSTSGAFSTDQQARLWIKSNPRIGLASSCEIQVQRDKNVSAINGVPQKDATLTVRILVSGDHQHFTDSDVASLVANCYEVFRTNGTRIFFGGES